MGEVAVEQGLLAALTPLRDLFSLADLLPLVAVGVILVFRFSTELWTLSPSEEATQPTPAWVTFSWVSAALYGLYRMAVLVASGDDLPMGASLLIEPLIVPILMLVTDALLVSWVLVELRRAVRSSGVALVEVSSCLTLLPVALLACLFAMPSRYVAPTAYLMLPYVSDGVAGVVLAPLLGGWGLTYLQASALLAVGLVGVVPWCRGGVGSALVGYGRLLRTDGGHLVAALSLGGMAAGIASAIAYLLVLTLPPQPWVLSAADSYAHYGTLVTGLALLSALVELGARSSSGSGSEEQARQSEASLLVR